MKFVDSLLKIYRRFHYPVSLPEEVAGALGIEVSSKLPFEQFISVLVSPQCCPTKLRKYMSRSDAEAAFGTALRKERFQYHSLYSYYFCGGWMAFHLQFDQELRLRRIYIHHRELTSPEGVELGLT